MGLKVALALGAGGAKGYAHVGAVQELRARGHEVVSVAGTSMGALVGAFVAADRLDDFERWATALTQRDVLRLLDPTLSGPGVVRGDRIISVLAPMLGQNRIEDLPVAFTAVATDLDHRREVWFQKGPLDIAIRASIALPGFITPVVVEGRTLVDGGLMNPVPIEPTRAVPADFTIAISLNGAPAGGTAPEPSSSPLRTLVANRESLGRTTRRVKQSAEELREHPVVQRLSQRIAARSGTPGSQDPVEAALDHHLPRDLSTMDLFVRSFDTMSALVARYRMASNPADIFLSLPTDSVRTLDFHRAAEMIELGRSAMAKELDGAGL